MKSQSSRKTANFNEGSVYRICNKNVGNPQRNPDVQDAFDECVEEVSRNIEERTSGMKARLAMPDEFEDMDNPIPDHVQDKLDNMDDLEIEELEDLSTEITKNEYGGFDHFEDLSDSVQAVIMRKEDERDDYELNRDQYEREDRAEAELDRMRDEGEMPPTRFGKLATTREDDDDINQGILDQRNESTPSTGGRDWRGDMSSWDEEDYPPMTPEEEAAWDAEMEEYARNMPAVSRDPEVRRQWAETGVEPPPGFVDKGFSRQGKKNNEYAICTVSVGREDEAKFKECKESVRSKKSSLGDKRMSSQLKPAIRTARSFLASGMMGSELWHQIQQAHPHLTPDSKNRLAAYLRREVGFLGQVAHNPNLYPTCKTARIAKERHPRKEGLILTYRTPMCGSCTANKEGRCALMGGRLVAGPEETPETAVVRTANRLVNQESLGREEANRISKAKAPAGQRVAALTILATQRVEDPNKDIAAVQGSRQAASILDPAGNSMEIPPQSRKGPGRVANSDQLVGEAFDFHPGDENVSQGACRVASLLNPAEIPVEVPDSGAAPRNDVQMDPFATFTVPKRERGTRSASAVAEESVDQAHQAYNKYARIARKLLSGGHMTTEIAARLYGRMDELKQFGVVPTEHQSRVARQVGALAGHLEM